MNEIPQITWFDISDKTDEEFNMLSLNRFNIKNIPEDKEYNLDNYYVFKIHDPDSESKTGYYGMCIKKDFAQQVKQNLELWKKNSMKK